jgi:hypothetical protein
LQGKNPKRLIHRRPSPQQHSNQTWKPVDSEQDYLLDGPFPIGMCHAGKESHPIFGANLCRTPESYRSFTKEAFRSQTLTVTRIDV